MGDTKKFKVTIKQVIEEEYEMTLEDDSIVKALDEARRLVEVRNKTSKHGKFHVTKIETEE
jgi:hypothetical protein